MDAIDIRTQNSELGTQKRRTLNIEHLPLASLTGERPTLNGKKRLRWKEWGGKIWVWFFCVVYEDIKKWRKKKRNGKSGIV